MYGFLRNLLMDKTGGITFQCFDAWHIGFIVLFGVAAVLAARYLRGKNAAERGKVISAFAGIAFGIYMLDFFLMPLAYGQIDTEKLPFHACTTMCVLCFASRHNGFLGKYRLQFAALGFLSNFIYLMYPAGVMWYGIHPLSYRVVQTLVFHGFMVVYGVLVLIYESDGFAWRKCYRDLVLIVALTGWAMLGNAAYSTDTQVHNWFFVSQDPFGMLPADIAGYIMPELNIVLFFGVEMLVYLVFGGLKRKRVLNNI